MHRRQILKAAISGTASLALVGVHRAVLAGANFDGDIENPFLTPQQKILISTVSELIIPRTETPGAIDAGVPQFMELMLSDWYSEEERQPFIEGLALLDQRADSEHGAVFSDLHKAEQTQILKSLEKTDFFEMARELTVLGYYTSEVGVEAELFYNPMPGAYKGDVDFSDTDRQQVN